MLIEEYTDRYGQLNEEILLYMEEKNLEYLLKKSGVETFKQTQAEITVVFEEESTSRMNASKLFDLSIDLHLRYKRFHYN